MLKHLILPLLAASTLHAALPGGDALAGLILDEFDRDADALVGHTEWDRGLSGSFAMLDDNGDGSIAGDEVDALRGEIAKETGDLSAGLIVALVKQAVLALDADQDKLVSRKEYDALALGIFDKLDADKSKSLTRAELTELPLKLIAR